MTAIPTGNGGTLMVVADGAGGVKGGRAAADKTVSAMEGYFRRHKQVGNEAVALKQAIKSANSAVHGHLEGKSTVVALWVGKKGQARIAHAGDSRAYLMRNGKLTLLTKDHTQLQQLRDSGKSERELKAMGDTYYRWDSTLVNYIGKKDINVALSSRLQLKKGDRILLCSDGLSGYVGDREIAQRMGQRKPAQSVAQDLVRLAKDRKSTDNITVQIYEHQG
jgi:protein phosphatase